MTYRNFTKEAEATDLVKSFVKYKKKTYWLLEAFDSKILARDWANELLRTNTFSKVLVRSGNMGCYGLYVME